MTQSGDQWPPADRDGPAADLAGNPGVIAAGFIGDPEAEARARLPADAAEAAWEEGRRMGVEKALEG